MGAVSYGSNKSPSRCSRLGLVEQSRSGPKHRADHEPKRGARGEKWLDHRTAVGVGAERFVICVQQIAHTDEAGERPPADVDSGSKQKISAELGLAVLFVSSEELVAHVRTVERERDPLHWRELDSCVQAMVGYEGQVIADPDL